MFMKLRIAAALLPALALYAPARAESVFLKSGPVVRGKIASESAAAITVTNERGERCVIPRPSVLRILYMDIYMGRMVVRLTDGSSFTAYLAFEDTDAYTFRREIDKPDEFIVPRKKVLFMARSNPTDLECRGRKSTIHLAWNPPYRPPARYRVYCKETGAKEYRVAGHARWTRWVIRGLREKTSYTVMVTAIDHDGTESLPSDERTVTTNMPPSPPRLFRSRPTRDVGGRALSLSWKKPSDRDGTVTAYRVYGRDDSRYRLVGETPATSLTIQDLDPGNPRFAIRSVDDCGGESEEIRFGSRAAEPEIEVRGHYLVPLSRMSRLVSAGYGATCAVLAAHDTFPPFAGGAGAGYVRFVSGSKPVRAMQMVPVYGLLRYGIRLGGPAFLSPELAAGASLVEITATSARYATFPGQVPRGTSIEPYLHAGMLLSFRVRDWLFINLNAGYAFVLEGRQVVDFVSCGVGLVARL